MNTNNTEYGTGKSTTQGMTRVGRKNQRMEREIENAVNEEMRQRTNAIQAKTQERYFDTTNAENFYEKDI